MYSPVSLHRIITAGDPPHVHFVQGTTESTSDKTHAATCKTARTLAILDFRVAA